MNTENGITIRRACLGSGDSDKSAPLRMAIARSRTDSESVRSGWLKVVDRHCCVSHIGGSVEGLLLGRLVDLQRRRSITLLGSFSSSSSAYNVFISIDGSSRFIAVRFVPGEANLGLIGDNRADLKHSPCAFSTTMPSAHILRHSRSPNAAVVARIAHSHLVCARHYLQRSTLLFAFLYGFAYRSILFNGYNPDRVEGSALQILQRNTEVE